MSSHENAILLLLSAGRADDAHEAAGLAVARKRQKAAEGDAEPTYAAMGVCAVLYGCVAGPRAAAGRKAAF